MLSERWTWLRSQGLGVICGLATVVLLAIGSFVLSATRGGASAGVRLDDMRAFFEPPSFTHFWFYLLLPVLTLYGINTFLATWHSVTTKWRNGTRDPQMFAAAFFHVGFLVALIAHLVGGVAGTSGSMLIDGEWRALPSGPEIRLTTTDVVRLPGGMPKTIHANVELRSADGAISTAAIGFNEPLTRDLGIRLVLLQQPVTSLVAVFAAGDERCALHLGESCTLAGTTLRLAELRDSGTHGMLARVAIGDAVEWMMKGMPRVLSDGTEFSLTELESRPAVFVSLRYAPGNPWAFVSALLLVTGVVLMVRGFV